MAGNFEPEGYIEVVGTAKDEYLKSIHSQVKAGAGLDKSEDHHGEHDHSSTGNHQQYNSNNDSGHGHSHTQFSVDIYNTNQAFSAVKWGTFGLLVTAVLQFIITLFVGSAGLLADALHNAGDVFTTVSLWVAFSLSRRAANRRYTYGYSRVEDVTGVIIILVILITAFLGGLESYLKWVNNERPGNLLWGMAGALIGVVGNEAVAAYKIKIGRRINSVPLVADGQHSRLDGLTSLAAFLGLIGVAFGFPQADPLAGLIITVVIAFVVFDAAKNVLARLMDAIDPKLVDELEQTALSVPGVLGVDHFRARWFGRNIQVVSNVEVASDLSLLESHAIAEAVRHALLHKNGVSLVDIHIDPFDPTRASSYHSESQHHFTAAPNDEVHNHEALPKGSSSDHHSSHGSHDEQHDHSSHGSHDEQHDHSPHEPPGKPHIE